MRLAKPVATVDDPAQGWAASTRHTAAAAAIEEVDLSTKRALLATDSRPDAPPEGERWTTWDRAVHGPLRRPDWVITDLGAVESDLGILKSGKGADVHAVRRWLPRSDRSTLMAAKRFRSREHRMFHRDAGYLEGRRVRRSRETRAMARRTAFGKELLTGTHGPCASP